MSDISINFRHRKKELQTIASVIIIVSATYSEVFLNVKHIDIVKKDLSIHFPSDISSSLEVLHISINVCRDLLTCLKC